MKLRLGALALAVGACTRPTAPAAPPSLETVAGAADPVPPWTGHPHLEPIHSVALDPTGASAVSVDGGGGVRVWLTLDGKTAPLLVPVAGSPEAVDFADILIQADGTRRIVVVTQAGAQLFTANVRGDVVQTQALAGVSAARLLPGDRILVARGSSLSMYGPDGPSEHTLTLGSPVTYLLTNPARTAVVAVTGETRTTEVIQYWADGDHVDVFEGTLIPLEVRDQGEMAAVRPPIPITAVDRPNPQTYALSRNGTRVALHRWKTLDVGNENDLDLEVEIIEVTGTERSYEHFESAYSPKWLVFDDEGTVQWEGKADDGSTLPALETDLAWALGIHVRAQDNWLHVIDDGVARFMGAARFTPHAVAWSPDGHQLAWATNFLEPAPAAIQFTTLDSDQPGSPVVLDSIVSVADMAWHAPRAILVAEWEGGVFSLDPTTEALSLLGRIDAELIGIEHDSRSGFSLIWDDYGAAHLITWRDDIPGPPESLEDLTSQGWRVGLARGGQGGVWVLSRLGLGILDPDDLREGTTVPSFAFLGVDPREAFDVTWTRDGDRIIDWGDRWQVSGDTPHSWLKDTPVFGPLLPSPRDTALLTLPECDDEPWRIAVHPVPASELEPGMSWLHEVDEHTKVRWSPDGTMLAIVADDQGAELLDISTRKSRRRWTVGAFEVRSTAPAVVSPLAGRCRTLSYIQDGGEY